MVEMISDSCMVTFLFQKPPIWAKVKKETKTANSVTPTKQDELSLEEQQALQKSR